MEDNVVHDVTSFATAKKTLPKNAIIRFHGYLYRLKDRRSTRLCEMHLKPLKSCKLCSKVIDNGQEDLDIQGMSIRTNVRKQKLIILRL